MPERWKLSLTVIATMGMIAMTLPAAYAGVPDTNNSFYVPQAGTVGTPLEGLSATPSYRFFRGCPNNDGVTSFPNNARVKVVVRDVNGNGIAGIAAADICLLFNGGTPAQSFSGVGADSVIANAQFNQSPLCPDVRCVQADDQTDATGTTYITFTGSTPGSPGVGTRSPFRKWGHYDTEIPVFVLGFKLQGRITTASANGTYTLQIKSYDHTGGLGTALNQGEAVTAADFNAVAVNVGAPVNALTWWRDFDSTGGPIAAADFNVIAQHVTHNCTFPNNP
jgi:hypothetical protein